MNSPTDPDTWIGYAVESSGSMVSVQIEGITESYTVGQARGLAAAIEKAADAAERGETLPRETCAICGEEIEEDCAETAPRPQCYGCARAMDPVLEEGEDP